MPSPLAPGMAGLLRYKMTPKTFRDMVLQGHRFTAKEALENDLVDEIAPEKEVLDKAKALALKWAPKAKSGIVYRQLKEEVMYILCMHESRADVNLYIDVYRCCPFVEHSLQPPCPQDVDCLSFIIHHNGRNVDHAKRVVIIYVYIRKQ